MHKVIPVERLSKGQLAIDEFLYPERNYWRPSTRADCDHVPRPCPYVGCRFNTYLHVKYNGNIVIDFEGEPWDVPPEKSCVLDLAGIYQEGVTLATIGDVLGFSRARAQQIEIVAKNRIKDAVDPDSP